MLKRLIPSLPWSFISDNVDSKLRNIYDKEYYVENEESEKITCFEYYTCI